MLERTDAALLIVLCIAGMDGGLDLGLCFAPNALTRKTILVERTTDHNTVYTKRYELL
jgi:hypothetical protein